MMVGQSIWNIRGQFNNQVNTARYGDELGEDNAIGIIDVLNKRGDKVINNHEVEAMN